MGLIYYAHEDVLSKQFLTYSALPRHLTGKQNLLFMYLMQGDTKQNQLSVIETFKSHMIWLFLGKVTYGLTKSKWYLTSGRSKK